MKILHTAVVLTNFLWDQVSTYIPVLCSISGCLELQISKQSSWIKKDKITLSVDLISCGFSAQILPQFILNYWSDCT